MTCDDYYVETIEISYKEFTGKDIDKKLAESIAADICVSIENENMAFGRDDIPNPLESELKNAKRDHNTEIESLESSWYNERHELEDTIRSLRTELYWARREND